MSHHVREENIEPTEAELAQINVNTIAINNNASNITTANSNIATNATNITTANNAISSNDTDITNINNNLATITTNVSNNASAISSNGDSITVLNTTTATNTTNIATNLATNNTQQTAINLNTTGRTTNATNIASNDTDIATNATNIATNATNISSNDTDIATNATNIATNLSTNNSQTTLIGANATNIVNNTSNIATNTTNIATNTTELNNITIGASQLVYKKWRMGEVGTQLYLQHADLNSGTLASTSCAMRVMDNGNVRLNAPTSQNIQFRINDVEQIRIEDGVLDIGSATANDTLVRIRADATHTATLAVGGDGAIQGTSKILWGQGVNDNGTITYGGGIVYNGDDNPDIGEFQDETCLVSYSNGTPTTVMSYPYGASNIYFYKPINMYGNDELMVGINNAQSRLIGKTIITADALQKHLMCYDSGGTAQNNTWFMPHTDFKCVCKTPKLVTKAEYHISFTTDGYYSNRLVYVCLSTSNSASNIIPETITFVHSRNSEWTSKIVNVKLYDTTLTANATNIRYVFVKEVYVNTAGTVISASGNQGWVLFGGRATHNGTTDTQTTHYYDGDTSPETPSDSLQALVVECYSIPSTASTTASNTNPFQFIGF